MRARDSGRAQLCERILYWSRRLKVEARIIRVQRMTRKWGSCSTTGIITLAEDLIEQEPGFQDFVIAHELLHLRVPTHGRLFKALMTVHIPAWRQFDVERRRNKPSQEGPAENRIDRSSGCKSISARDSRDS